MTDNLLVSIIVPVYKVEAYLEQCVRSIINQTYRLIEVILVDDGSPDNSGKLADELALEDERVRVVHKENGGLSSARNAGLEVAKGEYVLFVDSDDFWMDGTCLERLVGEMGKTPECDFIGFNCKYYYVGEETYTPWVAYDESIVNETNKESLIVKLVQTGTMPMSACLKIIKRGTLSENKITFQEGLLSEDIPWFLELLRKAKAFRMVNDYIYAYRQTSMGSITHSFSTKHFDDILYIISSELLLVQQSKYALQTKGALLSFLAYEWCILLGSLYKIQNEKERQERRRTLAEYKWLLCYTESPKVKRVARMNRLVGIRLTELALTVFMKRKQ